MDNVVAGYGALYFLAILLALLFMYGIDKARRSRLSAVLAFVFWSTIASVVADKISLHWGAGLSNNGSVATNDTVFIRGTYDPLMANDALHVDYRDRLIVDTPEGWARAYDGVVSDLANGFTVTIPDATNMVIWVWSEYIEPAPVHTNGEYRITYVGNVTNQPPQSPRYVLPRTPIKAAADGAVVWEVNLSPPELPEPPASLLSTLATENLTE